jgi:hypothetical protein
MRLAVVLLLGLAACRHDLGPPPPDLGGGNGSQFDLADVDGLFCVSSSKKVEQIGVDLLFLIDTSYSMDFNLKWEAVAQALKAFVDDPRFAGITVGLQYFPLRTTCDVPSYAQLAVPFSALPGAAPTIKASIDMQRMAGGTPTVPAMQGVLETALARAMANPDRKVILVFATDGVPDDSCSGGTNGMPNDLASVVTLVGAAATSSPRVVTYVVGVGSGLTQLNAIAAAGGTGNAFLVDTSTNVVGAFADTLDSIRRIALACEYPIPDPEPGLAVDVTRVNVTFTTDQPRPFLYVRDRNGCAAAPTNGWYYDDVNMPTKVVLCDAACDAVRTSVDGKIDIVFGCSSIIP